MPSSNPLPPKENALFRKILKCYEMKQYKNGLKLAKQILTNPKFTEHGETLAMKGLTLNCLGRKEEAYDYVRRGLRNDLKSHVCWHVYGLLQRSDKKYEEAIKCYRNALKWEKDNIQILRDLSLLQIQMRDLEGYRETRHQLFKLRPSQHASWIGFAMSYHLLGDYETANNILDTFRSSQTMETYDYKHSELLLYQNQVIQESGNYDKALQHLKKYQMQILDTLSVKEVMGELCLKLDRHEDAVLIYQDLIKRNPENSAYYQRYLEAMQITGVSETLEAYKKIQSDYPQSYCAKRLPLDVCEGDTFRALVDEHLRRNLRKGVPPLFVNLRSLYGDENKVRIITDLVEGYHQNLTSSGYFSAADKEKNLPKEPASALLWTLFYLAQHYDHLRESEKALDFINAAIEHTPTLIELFVTKGRIYKHAGDVLEAVKWMDEAQSLDTADRYINSKCAKYMLRANQIKEAEEICAKFTREGVSAMENLNEMQCMWFQTECALSYQRLEKWGEALKKCHEVDRHYAEIIEDQFDFHTYCMRKMTLRSYLALLRLEDVLRSHPFYFKAAKCAIEVYLRLFDKPLAPESAEEELDTENLPPSELKKLRNKLRKAAKKKAEQENAQAAQTNQKKEQHSKQRNANQDGDPEAPQLDELIPDKLARPEDPLEKAIEFLRPLQMLVKENIDTHLMAFEIYSRRGKLLLMLQSLKRARAIDANHPTLHNCIIRFNKILESQIAANEVDENVKLVIDRERVQLFREASSATELNDNYLAANRDNVDALYEAAKIMYQLDSGRRDEAVSLLTTVDLKNVSLEKATKVFLLLKSGLLSGGTAEEQLDAFKKRCQKRFPLAIIFADVAATVATVTTTQSSSPASSATTTTTATETTMCPMEQPSKISQPPQNNGSEIVAN
ncbi:N-alpha-acetyltransferase 15, NatA auxiliary subunit [Toxorhynchites rutilus septentrionalis]|uniref:N-alpha-acetyltransferase 15, NatA auxiliary subunit n=1 Tax=Toxorhynchites rutilus septentrionalis TaxID=329112 RepID=UPI00247A8C74|nr:N-alpha-acetyltransferase 15, NatA auxiliary subunit [Toxorhynchites rutilus septentrionalis]